MYTVLNQNVSWFYKKIKLGVRKPKIPQAQIMFTPAVHTPHIVLPQLSGRAVEFSGDGWDIYRHYLQRFLEITGRNSSLPFLVNLSLVSSTKRGKSENGCSAASPLVLHSGCEPE